MEVLAHADSPTQPTYVPLSAINGDDKQLWLAQQAISRGVTKVYADAWSADCNSSHICISIYEFADMDH
jgi:hypothetical protein